VSFLLEDFLTILYDDTLEVIANLLTSQVEGSTLGNLVLYGRNASFVNIGRCNLDRRYQDITSARVLLEVCVPAVRPNSIMLPPSAVTSSCP
jgi:hypothetical protein